MPSAYTTKQCERCGAPYATRNPTHQRYCSKHCAGIVREGTPRARLLTHLVHATDEYDCWSWAGHCIPNGYGSLKVDGRETLAHRLMWELTHGSIPDDLCVLHHCDNPPCCNPKHLFLGTKADNAQDALAKGRLYIPRGEANGNAKLTAAQVRDIRRADDTAQHLATRYGVSLALIGFVRQRKVWRHIE